MRQLHALHGRFDPAQGMSSHNNLVRGKDQAEPLLLVPGVKMRIPRRPREMATYHCCALVAALTVESENRT